MFYVVFFTWFLWEMSQFIIPQTLSSFQFITDFKLPSLHAIHSMKGEKR